jgi:DNA-binding NarL/FixJ family response regulator
MTKPRKKIRLLVADDHNVLREGLANLLEHEPDMEVVGQAATGREAVEMTRGLTPDIVIMDIGMPDLNGIDATRQIMGDLFRCLVICLSVHREKQLVNAMLAAGASGYLLKTSARRELVEAVRTVASGETYLSPPIASDVVNHHVRGEGTNKNCAFAVLTEREREVLQLIAEGLHSKMIGDRLHISPRTVLAHRENIMRKLNLDSVVALTRYALREGLSEL